jgi:hypothetical protein
MTTVIEGVTVAKSMTSVIAAQIREAREEENE